VSLGAKYTTVANSVILDNSFIGEHLHIENAIVWGNSLIRTDRNISITLEDDRLIGSLSHSAISFQLSNVLGRFIALVVTLLLSPLWALAVADAALINGINLFKRVRYIGNVVHSRVSHRQLSSFVIQTRFKVLAKLPLIVDILLGKIKWFGVSIVMPNQLEERKESWEFVRDQYPVGLIGPAQLELDGDSSIDEILMADATLPGCSRINLLVRTIKKRFGFNYGLLPQSNVSSR